MEQLQGPLHEICKGRKPIGATLFKDRGTTAAALLQHALTGRDTVGL